jgi:archaellum biogenesis protein FlaJ (TadC family)
MADMTPKEKANDLVNQYRMILMDEDTECGNEMLCTLIAIKSAKITCNEMIEHISKDADYGGYKVRYWKDVVNELDAL